MFIAYGYRQGSSPQRGDMFIAVALVNNNFFTHGVDEFRCYWVPPGPKNAAQNISDYLLHEL